MNKKTLILTAALLFGGALPAAADQARHEIVPSHRSMQIDEFMPQSGAPGSLVTVRGRGLGQVEYALVGGYKATPQHAGGHELSFRIPQQHGDGMIELYVPGRGNVAVGRFTVFSMLGIDGFSPASGKAGSQVEIRGQGFQHGDQVLMGDRQLTVLHVSSNRIVVRIPDSASTSYFTVLRHGGVSERATQPFYVTASKPSISSVVPQSGQPGTEVRIAGQSFDQSCKVFYGQEKLPALRHGFGSVDVRIPAYAEKDEYLYVNCAGEQGRSPQRFQLEQGFAEIDDVQPRQGLAGTRVMLRGDRLKKVDSVLLQGMSLPIVQRSGHALEVEIPYGARSGNIALQIRGQMQPTSFHFRVLQGATIQSFEPATARPGHTLTIYGQGFGADAQVNIGGYQATLIERSANQLRVSVPAQIGAGMQQIRVISGGRQVVAAQALDVRRGDVAGDVTIWRVAPGQVRAGANVTLRGQGFDEHTRVFWGHHELRVLGRSRNGKRIEVQAPSHTHGTQHLYVDNGSGRLQTEATLEIVPAYGFSARGELRGELRVN